MLQQIVFVVNVLQVLVQHLDPHVVRTGPASRKGKRHVDQLNCAAMRIGKYYAERAAIGKLCKRSHIHEGVEYAAEPIGVLSSIVRGGGIETKDLKVTEQGSATLFKCTNKKQKQLFDYSDLHRQPHYLRQGRGDGLMKIFLNLNCLKPDRSVVGSSSLCGVSTRAHGLAPSFDQGF